MLDASPSSESDNWWVYTEGLGEHCMLKMRFGELPTLLFDVRKSIVSQNIR